MSLETYFSSLENESGNMNGSDSRKYISIFIKSIGFVLASLKNDSTINSDQYKNFIRELTQELFFSRLSIINIASVIDI